MFHTKTNLKLILLEINKKLKFPTKHTIYLHASISTAKIGIVIVVYLAKTLDKMKHQKRTFANISIYFRFPIV